MPAFYACLNTSIQSARLGHYHLAPFVTTTVSHSTSRIVKRNMVMGDYLLTAGGAFSDASRMRCMGPLTWLFIAHLLHPLIYLFWDSPEDKELERQMLEWTRDKFPNKSRRVVHDNAD